MFIHGSVDVKLALSILLIAKNRLQKTLLSKGVWTLILQIATQVLLRWLAQFILRIHRLICLKMAILGLLLLYCYEKYYCYWCCDFMGLSARSYLNELPSGILGSPGYILVSSLPLLSSLIFYCSYPLSVGFKSPEAWFSVTISPVLGYLFDSAPAKWAEDCRLPELVFRLSLTSMGLGTLTCWEVAWLLLSIYYIVRK